MGLISYALGEWPRDGIHAITCENGNRPENVMDAQELVEVLSYALDQDLAQCKIEVVEKVSGSMDEYKFLRQAISELEDAEVVEAVRLAHEDAFKRSEDQDFDDQMSELQVDNAMKIAQGWHCI